MIYVAVSCASRQRKINRTEPESFGKQTGYKSIWKHRNCSSPQQYFKQFSPGKQKCYEKKKQIQKTPDLQKQQEFSEV